MSTYCDDYWAEEDDKQLEFEREAVGYLESKLLAKKGKQVLVDKSSLRVVLDMLYQRGFSLDGLKRGKRINATTKI